MRKTLSVLLLISILVISFPFSVFADTTVTVADSVTYSGDLITLTFTISSNVNSTDDTTLENGITCIVLRFDIYDDSNAKIKDVESCLAIDSFNVSGLADGAGWTTSRTLKNNSRGSYLDIQINEDNNNIEDYVPLYQDRQSVVEITFRKLDTATHDQIVLKPNSTYYGAMNLYGDDLNVVKSASMTLDLTAQSLTPTLSLIGAQIRTADPQGLRFIADFAKDDFYTAFGVSGNYDYARDKDTIQFGMFIALKSTVSGSLTSESTCKKLDIPAELILNESETTIRFTGVVINMPTDGSYDGTYFTAVAYVKVGSTYYYSNELERSVNYVKSNLPA